MADKKLFWFLKDQQELDLDRQDVLDMFIQQVLISGGDKDIGFLLKKIENSAFKESFERIKPFLTQEIRCFWEDYFGDN
ncbi:MAG: hypothetical protein ABH858_04185 [Candidatus Omnitrophota bacterium]